MEAQLTNRKWKCGTQKEWSATQHKVKMKL